MLKGIDPILSPELLATLRAMGHGDEIAIVDGNYPGVDRKVRYAEGIFVGTSSGGTLVAALDVARRAPAGSNIVCMLPDTGERYLSTPLFEGISMEMNNEELAIMGSLPIC